MLTTTLGISPTKTRRKQALRRGKQKKPVLSKWLKRHVNLSRSIAVLTVLIVIVVIMTSLRAIDTLLDVPLESVSIEGDSQFASKEAIQAIINASSIDGFVGIDLPLLHKQLQALPWVSQVTIKRRIPDQLVISIKEETVIARWNDNSYVTNNGDVIKPDVKEHIPSLPNFSGQDHKQVLNLYQRANKVLPDELKPIQSVNVSNIGVATLTLVNDTELVFDSGKFDQELGLWQKIYSVSLKKRITSIRRVDLRYANGVAVAFRQGPGRDSKSYIGDRD